MALSAFDDRSKKPGVRALNQILGRASVSWDALIAHLSEGYQPLGSAWNFAGAKWGWSLQLKHKKRTILYMTPCQGHFLVGLVLGEKAVRAAQESSLQAVILKTIEEATRYAEGRAIRIEVRWKKDLVTVKKLAAAKMAN